MIQRNAGDKLYFYQTGTSTPQDVFTTPLLNTPLDNPVEADADGFFPVIYLDGGGPDYRVELTDADDVQVWQKDNVLAAQREAVAFRIKSDLPELVFEETDAAPSEGKWVVKASGGVLTIALRNSVESVDTPFLTVNRTGTTIDSVEIAGPATIGGEPYNDADGYTGTCTGMTTAPTVAISAYVTGSKVTLHLSGGVTGTSNATTFTITGMPENLRPAISITQLCRVVDNGAEVLGSVQVATDGTLTFGVGVSTAGAFTGSGTKGLLGSWGITYERGQ